MSSHRPTVMPTNDDRWIGACTCRWRAHDLCATVQDAEDANRKHMMEVERLRANTRRTQPSLSKMRDYYEDMAKAEDDPDTKALWQQLADEISHRLNDHGPPTQSQTALW